MLKLGGEFFRETLFVVELVTHQTGDFARGSSDQEPSYAGFFLNVETLRFDVF